MLVNMKVLANSNQIPYLITGTCLQGYISITYAKLIQHFGEPTKIYPTDPQDEDYADGKVQVMWVFRINKDIVTLYDYKEYDIPKEQVTRWHFGAHSRQGLLNFISELEKDRDLKLLVPFIHFSL